MHWGRVGKKGERHQAECLLNSFDFFIKLLGTLIIWLAAFRALLNPSPPPSFFLKRKEKKTQTLILMLENELAFWPGANLVTVATFAYPPWGLSVEGCSVICWSKNVQTFSYQADCLDTRMQLPSQMLLASYSHPLCSVRTECRMNI